MSDRAGTDMCNVVPLVVSVNHEDYLSDVSPKHKPWDTHRSEADEVQGIYGRSTARRHHKYAERVDRCSQVLEFARDPPTNSDKQKLKLKTAWFCRVRYCPVCQWRRSLQWQARVYQALPRLMVDHPDVRFLFLTLTIKNCAVEALRYTLGVLAQGWKRLIDLRTWPALGWVRAVEITRGKNGSAHPHYHCLLMVPPVYFKADYLKQKDWAELWQHSLRIPYRPVVDIRVIKQSRKRSSLKVNQVSVSHMWMIVCEILKYQTKPSDMLRDHDWFLTLTDQVCKTRAVAVGGVLKQYLKERGRADLTSEPGEDGEVRAEAEQLFFGWKQEVLRYKRLR